MLFLFINYRQVHFIHRTYLQFLSGKSMNNKTKEGHLLVAFFTKTGCNCSNKLMKHKGCREIIAGIGNIFTLSPA